MNDLTTAVLVGLSLVLAVWSLGLMVANRSLDNPLFYGFAALEAGLVAQLVAGVAALADTERSVDGASFVGYLVSAILVPPVTVVWAVAEKSRWGTAVLVAGGLVAAVVVWRMHQVWEAGVA